jgi:hypothetical protein
MSMPVKRLALAAALCIATVTLGRAAPEAPPAPAAPPLALHPDNPHYFLFRGKPAVLVTSGEHYGAVLNLDFDFGPYLAELEARGFNLTRTFTGVYVESPESFGIERNTLAPAAGRLACPFARSDQPGYANGGNKFDLTKWDEAYFERLRAFVAEAGRRGVVVEVVLFCPFYEDHQWALSPFNARNNVNGLGDLPRTDVYALKDDRLTAVQDALVRKVVDELKGFDNVYYEVCNEPYFGGVSIEWQHHVIDTIVDAERELPAKHLIAQNIANDWAKVEEPHPAVSVFNFHYASPPRAVAENYALNKPIGDDETGFKGTGDAFYRMEAWDFLIAGGSAFSNLDYSFTPDHEGGTYRHTTSPGGGGPGLRAQLATLKRFVEGFDFVAMRPHDGLLRGKLPEGLTARVLAEPGKAYAAYVRGGTAVTLALEVPKGRYHVEWLHPRTGEAAAARDVEHPGGELRLESPEYAEDIAMRLVAK